MISRSSQAMRKGSKSTLLFRAHLYNRRSAKALSPTNGRELNNLSISRGPHAFCTVKRTQEPGNKANWKASVSTPSHVGNTNHLSTEHGLLNHVVHGWL